MTKFLRQILGYFAVFLMLGAVISSLGPTLPDLAANTGVGLAQIGILFTARSFGYLVGSFLGGSFYDKWIGHYLMGLLLLLASGAMAMIPEIDWLAILAVVIFIAGFTQGGLDVGSSTLLVWVQKERAGSYLNAMYFFAGLGGFLAPLYLREVGLDWGYRGIALLLIPVAIWLFLTPSPPIPRRIVENKVHLTQYSLFIGFAILAFLYIGVEVSYGGWIFTYLVHSGIGESATAYTLTSIFWLSVMFGRLFTVWLSTRFRAEQLITVFLLGAILSAAVMRFGAAYSLAVWVGTVGMGLSIAALFPTTYAFVQKRMEVSGRLNGLVWASGSSGAMILPWFVGRQIDLSGPLSMMSIILTVWLLAFLVFRLMAWRVSHQPSQPR